VSTRLYTVGHSSRSLDELVELLREHQIALLIDVRRYPGSRRNPQFARAALEQALPAAGIDYRWVEALGGRRPRRRESPHTAWRVAGFAGYADHMDTPAFQEAAGELLASARARRLAVMCAEARPEQCHRRLIADWATARGAEVIHIDGPGRARPHRLPEFARVEGGRILYDAGQLPLEPG